MASPRPDTIIKPSPALRRLAYRDGGTGDIIRVIMYADRLSGDFINARAAGRLRGATDYQTLENIYWFVKRNVNYRADAPGNEEIRSPGYLFQTGRGDCKSLSVAIAALCRALGIPYRYRFIRQRGASNYHHVYIVATPRDGSSRRATTVLLDAVHQRFDAEPAHVESIDLKPGQRIPAGIQGAGLESGGTLLLLFLLWLTFQKDLRK